MELGMEKERKERRRGRREKGIKETRCGKRSGNWKERGKKGRNKVESWEG